MNMIRMRQWQAMHAEIETLKKQLAATKQKATAYRISLENLEASLPKVRADAVRELVKGYVNTDHHSATSMIGWLLDDANKLEAGNE